ncbi:MAG: MlaD family protein [Elusimicrobia bacterium]|nr:MlaD family protein [Elusimicrobiota bacterium]
MSLETKVGAFVLGGLILLATAIFLLGDISLESRYTVNVTFHDVANLAKDSPVKLAGVEVGQVRSIELEGGLAKVVCLLRRDVKLYRGARFTIASTGIIGSKYLAIEQGEPSQGVIPPGAVVAGVDPVSLEKAMTQALESLQSMLKDLTAEGPRGSLTQNLRDTVANVREMTASLNDLIETTKPSLEKGMDRMDQITAKLDSLLAKSDQMMTGLATDQGAVGALIHDPKVKEDVKQTIASVKDAANTAKDVFGRITQFRVWWNLDWRYEHALRTTRADIGLKISPREGRYYYLGGSNLANLSDASTHGTDYAEKNRIDGLLGFEKGPFDLAAGVIRSAGGGRLTVTPFWKSEFGRRFKVMGQGYDFGRNRVVNSRRLDHPHWDFGALARVTRWFGIGARVEDVQETKSYQTWANVMFEDQDVAYLFGLASFGAAGTKGRSKSQ